MSAFRNPTALPACIDIMNRWLAFLLTDRAGSPARAAVALRVAVGLVFCVSGAMKLVSESAGPLRFAKIGFPWPAQVSAFVSTVEVVAGLLIVAGLFVRLAAVPLVVDMIVALATTKLPLVFSAGVLTFAYEARLDVVMLVSCGYFVAVGTGRQGAFAPATVT